MANDRLYLTCPCGESFMLAKRMGGAWYVSNSVEEADYGARLNKFLEEHFACDPANAHKFFLFNELEEQEHRNHATD